MGTFKNSEDPDEMRHYTICKVKKIFRQKNTTPRYVHGTVPSLLYQTRRKNPLIYKGLILVVIL